MIPIRAESRCSIVGTAEAVPLSLLSAKTWYMAAKAAGPRRLCPTLQGVPGWSSDAAFDVGEV